MAMLIHAEETPLTVLADNHDKAFAELYNSYFPRVYNYVRYRVDDSTMLTI
jgi:DNA-directed RNA polymerase specialized sigma24 family protein